METFYLLFLCVILKNTDGIKKQKINPFAESLHLPETVNTEKPKFEKIVNGRNAVEGEFPFQVSLQVASATGNHHLCGGSILSEKYVLTAAHCLSNTNPEENPVDVIVSAGIVDIREQNQSCEAESFIVHENFDTETLVNDIAIIKVNPEFVFSDLVSAVRLPEPDQDLSPLTEVELIGWGATQQGATISPSILQKTQSYIYDREQCIFGYMTDGKPMNENIICAYDSIHGSDTCQGDSGGPLLVNKSIQHGIVSWGIGCGTNPGVYTRVSKYINWIKEITSDKDEDSLYIRAKCGQLNEDTNYFDTSRINVYDFSWVAFLRYRTPMTLGVNCSGVLISTHHVLTAAQCVYEQDPQVVTLNEHGLSFPVSCQEAGNGKSLCTDTVQGTIKNIIVHPEYNPKNQKNNLAILKLADNVPEYLNPICLPNKRTKMPKRLSVAGFGNSVDNKKRWSFLDSINSVTCQKRYKTVSEDQICAGLDHGDSCVSDIGGPVFTIERLEDYSFGHTVFGIRTNLVCNGKGNPGVFTKIQPHMKWILSVINDRSFEKLVMQKKIPVNPQQNKFNIRLLRVYEKHTLENFVIGTSNIKLAMMALAEVAAENTRKEIIRNLNLYEGSIDQMVSTLLTPIKGVELHQAIRVWGKDAVVNKNFEGNLNSYGVQLQIVDLDGKVETERAVNDWIKKSTMENFDLNINLQSVESGTKMLLTTAVFFKGIWKYSFQKTTRGCFKLSTLKDGCHDVTYIVNTGLYKYGVNRKLDVEIVEIPYEGDQVSMVVILPFEKELSAINRVAQKLESMSIPNLLANLEEQRVNLEIPKFSLRVQTPMDEYLNFLQLPHLHPKGKFFTKFDDDSIKFSGFVQIAGIEVVQDGTMYMDNNMDIDDTGTEAVEKQFIADKPFIFLVWDKESSEILIAGRLTDPTKKN